MSAYQFPYLVDRFDDLDATVQQVLMAEARSSASYRMIVAVPPYQHFGKAGSRSTWLGLAPPGPALAYTLAVTSNDLTVVTRHPATGRLDVTLIPFAAMVAFELGVVLLHSWLGIVWADTSLRRTRIEYNAVGEPHIRSLLAMLQRAAFARQGQPSIHHAPVDVEPLFGLSMKFYDALRHRALLADEQLHAWVFEPGRKPNRLGRGGRLGILWAVTNYQGILIRDTREAFPYGSVYAFCPWGTVRNAQVVEHGRRAELCITVSHHNYLIKAEFPLTRAADLVTSTTVLPPQLIAALPVRQRRST
jgi:hypothetical protein